MRSLNSNHAQNHGIPLPDVRPDHSALSVPVAGAATAYGADGLLSIGDEEGRRSNSPVYD